jgi:hypothetical protein
LASIVSLATLAGLATPMLAGARGDGEWRIHDRGQLRGVVPIPNWFSASQEEVDADLAAAEELGAEAVKMTLAWTWLEPADGVLQRKRVARVTHFLRVSERHGLAVIATVGFTPCWATAGVTLGVPCALLPPAQPASFRDFVRFVASRWGERLAGLEVWSEPNFERTFRGSAADYAKLVQQAHRGVEASRHPQIPLVAGALGTADVAYLTKLLRLGISRWSDAVSVHPYDTHTTAFGDPTREAETAELARWSFASGVPAIRRAMKHAGNRDPIWITEFGYASCPAVPLCVEEPIQADYLVAALRHAAGWRYVDVVMVFQLRDWRDTGIDWEGHFGLLHRDRTPKPAFWAVRREFASASGR